MRNVLQGKSPSPFSLGRAGTHAGVWAEARPRANGEWEEERNTAPPPLIYTD